ncbi:MAG: AAA family ATPase [Endomicrobia bacterium]|nr:AAA family ATPase [Endomicrobiia bacterium]MDW8055822.1 AAA family ATPase [Elusimicrobiota bacterium]
MSFKDVFGQEYAINLLLNDIKSGSVKHSYIFYGVKGVGKKFTAIQFVKSLMCEKPYEGYSCDKCDTCIQVDDKIHPDVIVVDFDFQDRLLEKTEKANVISIDTIRYVKHFCSLTSFSNKYKVVIIDSAETLQRDAANSLLKLLEEPPINCVVILITTSIGLLPKTVLSRCQQVKFLPLDKKTINEIVKDNMLPETSVLGSIEEIEYTKRFKNLDINIFGSTLFDLQRVLDDVVVDKNFAKYFLLSLFENFLDKNFNFNEGYFQFLDEVESYIKEFRYNIDYRILLETFLVRLRQICTNDI